MPLREDLLEPIPGNNPSGQNLYYDRVFDQIKEARIEDEDLGPAGDWGRPAKKADHILVIKLAGETLAKRTKDLRLAAWLVESLFLREGFGVLVPCLSMVQELQEQFWDTFYPEMEEDGNMDLRVVAVEAMANRLALGLRKVPLTRTGFSLVRYREARVVGHEEDASTSDKQAAREEAIEQGKPTGEEFDKAFAGTPKSFYVEAQSALSAAAERLRELDRFLEEKYGYEYPSTSKLRAGMEEVHQVVSNLLNERRKTDPDAQEADAAGEEAPPEDVFVETTPESSFSSASVAPAVPSRPAAAISSLQGGDVYTQVVRCALALLETSPESPSPYLVCAGLRLGETRLQGSSPEAGFAVGPSSEVRQKLRALALEAEWTSLLQTALAVLAQPCARAWLDLQRYIWRAAQETGASALAAAVTGTVRALLEEQPQMRHWTLEDDTAAANPETQAWLDTEVVRPEPVSTPEPEGEAYVPPPPPRAEPGTEDTSEAVYETALDALRSGRADEAVAMMVQDAEVQASGRMRFRRRLQVAQMCVSAGYDDVGCAVLEDLTEEIDRRGLDTWEGRELLSPTLALLLQCLDRKGDINGNRAVLFARLCRLDPKAAVGVRG